MVYMDVKHHVYLLTKSDQQDIKTLISISFTRFQIRLGRRHRNGCIRRQQQQRQGQQRRQQQEEEVWGLRRVRKGGAEVRADAVLHHRHDGPGGGLLHRRGLSLLLPGDRPGTGDET